MSDLLTDPWAQGTEEVNRGDLARVLEMAISAPGRTDDDQCALERLHDVIDASYKAHTTREFLRRANAFAGGDAA